MTDRQAILKEIRNLTNLLVGKNISIKQNYPKYTDNEIIWENYANIAFSLKDEPYETIYNSCVENRDYNFMLIDGGIIQLKYQFIRNKITGHVLSYYPNPNFEKYQDIPDKFEELYFGNELFTDILDKKTIIFPIRFDFSETHTDIIHPKVHATFGNYTDCRIPISKPISPNRFVSFVLRNFYYHKFLEENLKDEIKLNLSFDELITNNEKELIHLTYK